MGLIVGRREGPSGICAVALRMHPFELIAPGQADRAWERLCQLVPWPDRAHRIGPARFAFSMPIGPEARVHASLEQLAIALREEEEGFDPRIVMSFGYACGLDDEARLLERADEALAWQGSRSGARGWDQATADQTLQQLARHRALAESLSPGPRFSFSPLLDRTGALLGGAADGQALPAPFTKRSLSELFHLARDAALEERLWVQLTRRGGEALAEAGPALDRRFWVPTSLPLLATPSFEESLQATRDWLSALQVELGLRLPEIPRRPSLLRRLSSWAEDGVGLCAPLSEAARGRVEALPLQALEVEGGAQHRLCGSHWLASVVFALVRAAQSTGLQVMAFDVSNRDTETRLWRIGTHALARGIDAHETTQTSDGDWSDRGLP